MRKRCWKTVLSAILASAMLFTSVPTNLTMTVHAEELDMEDTLDDVNETEGEDEQENENLTGNEADEEQNVQNPVGEDTNVEDPADDGDENVPDDSDDVSDQESVKTPKTNIDDSLTGNDSPSTVADDPDAEETYAGPTIDYDPESDDPGAVTFYYPLKDPDKDEVIERIHVRGSWDTDWKDRLWLKKDGDLWSVTLPTSQLKKDAGAIYYGFGYNAAEEDLTDDATWSKDPANPNPNGNCAIHRNPDIDNDSNVTLYYYPSHGKYPTTVKVKYRKVDTSDYTEVEMSRDSVESAVYSVKLTGLAEAEYEYYFDVDGDKVEDTNNEETGKIILVNYPEKDENVTSPEIKDGKVTFNYYGPGQKNVQLAGSMNNWSGVDMTYDPATAYWSITLDLGAGFHQYKFISSKLSWITDPLHEGEGQLFKGNSYFVIAGLENAEASVGVGDSTELPTTLTLWNGDEATDEPAADASKAVTYALSAETNTTDYKDKITLDTETKDGVTTTTVSVAEDFPADVNDFTLTASDGNNHTSTVTVTVIRGVSPIIDGKTVTFIYENNDATEVYVAGNMSGWGNTVNSDEYKMTKNADSGYWELTKEMSAGSYEYKYVYYLEGDGEKDYHWTRDPLNPNKTEGDDPNNTFVIVGLADANVVLNRNDAKAELASKLQLFDEDGESTEVSVTYDKSEETKNAAYKDAVEVTEEDGKAYVSITKDFPEDVKEFTLTATDANENSSKVTVTIVDKTYKYTIYYYDRNESHRSVEAAELWIWNEVAQGEISADGGNAHSFQEAVELTDGNTWLKAEVPLSYTSLGIIPKVIGGKDVWTWQEANRYYTNTDEDEEVTLYIVSDDGAEIYTDLPEIREIKERYLVAEYTRTTQKDRDWYFYTWNGGYGDAFVKFEDEDGDGTGTAKIPVKQGLETISFCLERTDDDGAHWGEKDGNDYTCPLPVDQNVIKIKIEEGKGITYTYPYNTGYEIDTKKGKINFYYRDDEAFLAGSEGGYADVSLEVIAPKADTNAKAEAGEEETLKQTVKMTYDEKEQRYEYVLDQLVPGDHYYRYGRQKDEGAETEYVLDAFNELKGNVAETEYSVLKYDLLDVEMEAEIQNATMDYNDNNVLSIKVNAKDLEGNPVEDTSEFKVVEKATVDLSAVGGGITEIDPELLALSIAVKQGTSAGEKTLPITIYDVYNNEYTTDVKVTVVDRSKGSDFDWDEAVIYFAVTDRFFDGNTSNNNGDASGSYDKDTNNGSNSSYHGGDFAGLTQKLDYLKDLGVNTIWITPIVENQTIANSVTDPVVKEAWGYHGYWAKDFTKLDSHLGTEAEFSALLDAAHAKGMKIMVDVVLNHSGYGEEITNYFDNTFTNEDGDTITMLRTAAETVNGNDQMSSLSGLPDFRTEDPEVRDLLVEWQSNWISKYPIDYYRVDTVKHVDGTTWSAFKNALTEINPDFKMIGEWAGAGYGTDTGMLNSGRMDSLLDFDFNDRALDFVTGKINETENFLSARNASINNTASLGSFLSSHDEDGFVFKLTDTRDKEDGGYGYRKSPEEAEALALVAASLQLTAKGQVVIYYGEEIGTSGQENYPYNTNRNDFNWSKASADNKTLAHYKKMLAIRNMYSEVLAKGTRETISTDNRLDVFTRSYGDTTLTIALNIDNQEKTYTLTGQAPNTALVDYYSGTQFDVDASGNAVITVPAAADGGTVVLGTENFRIDLPADGGMQIRTIPDQTYTGLSIKLPEDVLQVYAGSTRLTAGVDYTVSYKNNKAVGTATVTIKGKGNYKDTVTAQFNIVPKPVDQLEIDYQAVLIKNGKVQKPLSKITNNGKKLTTKEYQVEYYQIGANGQKTLVSGVKEVGEYQMVITGLKNYTGTFDTNISVVETGTYTSKLQITLEYTSKVYTGEALEPDVTVKNGDELLTKDTDYTVSYSNNVNVGTANVVITGKSAQGYYGSVTKTFKITGTELSKVAQVDTSKWQKNVTIGVTGSAQQTNAVLKAKNGQKNLTKGKDYTVSYSNNTKPGTATAIFTGAGAYTGTIKKTFKISAISWKQADLGGNLVINVEQNAPYSKKGATTAVTVSYKNKILAEGKDYKLTYKNNKGLTVANAQENKKPFVEVTGMGSYSGKVKAGTFNIVQADLSDVKVGITVTAPDVEQASGYESKPVVKAADGTYLTKGADYTVTYHKLDASGNPVDIQDGETLPVDTRMQATVTGNGNYTGEVSKKYRIVGTSISKATIIVKAQTYTGKAITLDADDFSKARIGKQNLTYGTDYEIVPDSYEKNVNKGNATVTVRGIGDNYGGEKKVTFRITSSGMRWWWNLFS
ncbi:MAG: hypothetical protein HDR06_04980 [Lachnospiraceae bacterium]|nr:hypothetical protein [Lachnospiraceae bacterium]